jgi:predicted RNA methylase
LIGKPFLDIGCGSGLSMVAALRLGASEARGVDVDQDSVSTAQRTLELFAGGKPFSVKRKSVFDLDPQQDGRFPIVYSWGVLHHTGDMWKAIDKAASVTAPNGLFAFALYRSTPMCPAWKLEKRFYASAPQAVQGVMRGAYKGALLARITASGQRPIAYIDGYSSRGMSWSHDVHDWLGGHPYESTGPDEVIAFLLQRGLDCKMIGTDAASAGVFGAGCNEYVAIGPH